MDCPDITNLTLSDDSVRAINRIKRIPSLANKLAGAMSTGVVANIFASRTPTTVTLNNIKNTDWRTFSRAMASIPSIARASIEREAYSQWFNAQRTNNHPEAQFWEAVANGCKLR